MERAALSAKQGRRMFGVDLKIIDEKGNRAPPDGATSGELFVRGPAIVSGYFNNPEASAKQIDGEGWFGTGDVAKITPDNWLLIVDRTKDLVKSGGEWISSIDVENAALACKGIANCAVIGVPHPKWHERPLLVVVKAPRRQPQQGRDPRRAGREGRQVAAPRRRGVRRRPAHDGNGQDLQEGPARQVRRPQAVGV